MSEKCDNCGWPVNCKDDPFYSVYSSQDYVVWCESCILKNKSLFEEMGVPYDEYGYGIWSSHNNIELLNKIKFILKNGSQQSDVPTEKSFVAAKIINDVTCKLQYYGIKCDCQSCFKFTLKNQDTKNIFGYSNEELFGRI